MTVLPPNIRDRFLSAIRKLILQECPSLTYAGLWEYAVTSVNSDGSVNGTPTDSTIPLPGLNNVPLGGLAAGGTSVPTVGTNFLVEFGDQDGSKYIVTSVAPTVKDATIDAFVSVNMGPTAPVNLGPGAPASPATPAVPGGNQKTAVVINCSSGSGALVLVETSSPNMFDDGDTVAITGVVGTTEANTMSAITIVTDTTFLLQTVTFANPYVSGGDVIDASYVPPPPKPATPAMPATPPSKMVARGGDGVTVWLPMGLLSGVMTLPVLPPTVPIVGLPMQVANAFPGLIVGGNSKVRA